MADLIPNSNQLVPADLQIQPQTQVDKNYYNFKATGLKIDKNYSVKFQWVYKDGSTSDWSPGYFILTDTESVPAAPSVNVPSTAIGNIPVTLSTFPQNAKRVDIYIIGGVYGTGKVADSFFQAGTKNIPVTAGVYQVSLITVTPSGINGDPTNTFTVTISNIVTEDTTAPNPISSAIATSGIRPGDSSGQLGFINLAITNSTIPSDFAGYIVKVIDGSNSWTQTFNSSTDLSNLYIGTGILVGRTYNVSVATTDGKNISSYVNASPSSITVTDNRTNSSTVSGALSFSATDSILTVSWSPSTDANVDSYRVQLTSNADTTFATPLQTIFSKGTTATFGGLNNNTTYRVRVTTKFGGSTGALSSQHTVGTFTMDASGAISDGIAPTTNPALTASMVKSLFGAFAITFPPAANTDAVTYEIFIKQDNATGIVDNLYKVLEVSGTFAVVKTLADRTTPLSYGTNYYIAIRAKDNDGISTGVVTPVGPVQTLQVANADLAADSVYANNIKAGEIDATKLTADTVLANQKITVGSNTALDRVRLDATNATIGGQAVSSRIYIGGGNYYDTASPFYADNLGRLSIGQGLKFESGALTINGSGTFTGTVTAGAGLNTVKVGNDVSGTNDGIYINATGDYIYTDGTLRLGNGQITYASGVLTVTGDVTANAIAANTSFSSPIITGGSYKTSTTVGNGSASSAGIKIDTSGIYGYPANSSTASFSVSNTGIMTANSGTIGGWAINSTQLRSNSTNQISLNPSTPKIALIQGATLNGTTGLYEGGTEKITIDPVEGIVGPNITYNGQSVPSFKLTPSGNLTLYGSITVTGGNAATTDLVNAKNKTFYQTSGPTNPINGYSLVEGDIWFDTDDGFRQYRWSGSAWVDIRDSGITTAINNAALAKSKADTALQQGGNEIRNASNQITTINSTGITITGSSFSLNGNGTATVPSANSLVINSSGITAQNASGQTTFNINGSTGDATFRGTVTGSRVTTESDSYYGSIRMGYAEGVGLGSTLEVVGSNGSVYGQLYQYNNGTELILRHGNTRQPNGYPNGSGSANGQNLGAMLSLNPYTITLQYVNATGGASYGLDIGYLGDNRFTGTLQSSSSGGTNSVGNTLRYIRNTVINNVAPSGSGFSIGDIWIQY